MTRLAYYGTQFPFPQGASAGPYSIFPSRRRGARFCIIGRQRVLLVPKQIVPAGPLHKWHGKNGCGCKHALRLGRALGDDSDYDLATSAGMPAGVLNTSGQLVTGSPSIDPSTGLPLTVPNAYVDTTLTPLAVPDSSADASSGAPQSPAGTVLLYTASWSAGLSNLFTSPDNAIAAITAKLGPYGMSVQSGQATADGPINYAIQALVLDSVGHALLTDAKSVLDSLMQQTVGNLSGSTISIATSSGLPFNLLNWLTTNWMYVALGVGAVVVWRATSK